MRTFDKPASATVNRTVREAIDTCGDEEGGSRSERRFTSRP